MKASGLGRPDLTAHGFRSAFRDWAAENTDHPSEVVEMARAHIVDVTWRRLTGEAICSASASP